VFGDSQFTSTLSVNFHFPKIPRRTLFLASEKIGLPMRLVRRTSCYSCVDAVPVIARERRRHFPGWQG
ncbi:MULTISPECIES: hypothetical protein, partial [unclassified Aeromonas]|uniref:hypothetical protein n=1 Tax=unclassified Aeromonas TaxID=257493 RepID=UPI0022DF64CF